MIQRAAMSFSGRSVSRSSSGTRPDVDAPELGRHLEVADGHRDGHGLAVGAGDEGGGRALGIGVDPVLVLPAAGVDALAEVALAVEQADGDERQRPVRGLLQDVAGERPEAAGVDGQRAVHAVLGAEEGRGAVGRRGRVGGRAREVGLHRRLDGGDPLEQRGVARGALQRLGRRFLEQAHGVLPAALPAVRADVPEHLRAVGRPGPAVVVGEAREGGQGLRDAGRQRLCGAGEVVAASSHAGP